MDQNLPTQPVLTAPVQPVATQPVATSPTSPAAPSIPSSSTSSPTPVAPQPPIQTKSSMMKPVAIILLLILLIGGGAGAYYMYMQKSQKAEMQTQQQETIPTQQIAVGEGTVTPQVTTAEPSAEPTPIVGDIAYMNVPSNWTAIQNLATAKNECYQIQGTKLGPITQPIDSYLATKLSLTATQIEEQKEAATPIVLQGIEVVTLQDALFKRVYVHPGDVNWYEVTVSLSNTGTVDCSVEKSQIDGIIRDIKYN